MKRLLAMGCVLFFLGVISLARLVISAELPEPRVEITVVGQERVIRSNGIPNHRTGMFPTRSNPNAIRAQRHEFRVPARPRVAAKITRFSLGKFGVAVNGIPFDPGAAEFWQRNFRSGWQYEALTNPPKLGMDFTNAHVQPNGAYHYHGVPKALIEVLARKKGTDKALLLIGYAADGFPIYGPYGHANPNKSKSEIRKMKPSYQLRKGNRPGGREPAGKFDGTFVEDYEYVKGAGDLDECNGRFGVTPEYPKGSYHYYLTEEFPFIPRAFRGTPARGFVHPPGPPPFPPPFGMKGPPPFKKGPPR